MRLITILDEKDEVFSKYCIHATSMTFKLPGNVSTMEGGLMESLAMVMYTCELFNAGLGGTAVVLGAGCISLVIPMSLRVRGVNEICVADVLNKHLEEAKELGVTRVFNSRNENIEEFVNPCPFHKDGVVKAVIKM